ncbi:N-acetylmuramoyl-L-alanine amidase [Nonomuraea sp. NPDC050536]|uniref:N-acetylmuramoyl-L-alanine amidase n=1 Tax=Nonomuraea sp. NPDC050536 TaxID=3364366 RepID=UPI0037C8E5DA
MRALPASVLTLCALTAAGCGGVAQGDAAAPGRAPLQAPAASAGKTATKPATTPAAKPLQGLTIVIDPGHNGGNYRAPKQINQLVDVLTKKKPCDTTGTDTVSGYTEAAFSWDVSNRIKKILQERGATVKLTRSDNNSVGPCITERAAIGNRAKAAAALSVHGDGAAKSDHGFHVIMPKKINGPVDPVVGKSRALGVAIRDAYLRGTGIPYSTYIGKNALDFRDDLGGLNLSTVPKVFVECGNMKNPGDAAKFEDPRFRQKMALALANGLQHYLKA